MSDSTRNDRPEGQGPVGQGLAARRAAIGLLQSVLDERRVLSQVLSAADGPLAGLSPSDSARAQRLCLMVLRNLARIDQCLAPHLRKAPPASVHMVLRLAVAELAEATAAHAVVHSAVELVRRDRKSVHFAGLVNAVLRKLGPQVDLSAMPVPKLPRWIRQPMVNAYGRPAVEIMENQLVAPPPVDLSLMGATVPEGLLLPNGSLRLFSPGQISALPGFAEGHWWVQDAAASMAVPLLAPRPGERVLDLCAAPGGKTLQLAAAGADVTALDLSADRVQRLTDNLARTGLKAEVICADALTWVPGAAFDAILLDAPCSATGTFRRHPDLPFVKDDTILPDLVALQARLVDHALTMLAPGGRLVFCTCSLLPQEGEDQLDQMLARHPGLRVLPPSMPWIDPAWTTAKGGLRLRPDYWADRGGMDGFFMACVTRET